MVAWGYLTMPSEQELKERKAEQARQDSIAAAQADSQQVQNKMTDVSDSARQNQQETDTAESNIEESIKPTERRTESESPNMGPFSEASVTDTSLVTINTPLYKATFTNAGAGPAQIMLKEYDTWNHQPVRLVEDTTQSAYSLGFLTTQNFNVETDNLVFKQLTETDHISIGEGESKELKYALTIDNGQRIVYTYTLNGDSYEIDLDISFEGLDQTIVGGTVDFGWEPELQFTEKNLSSETRSAAAYVYTGGELEKLGLSEAGHDEKDYNGTIDWVATRTKFFTQAIKTDNNTQSALLVGEQTGKTEDASTDHHYKSFITTDISQQGTVSFQMYLGPLAYNTLKHYNGSVYNMVDTGYS